MQLRCEYGLQVLSCWGRTSHTRRRINIRNLGNQMDHVSPLLVALGYNIRARTKAKGLTQEGIADLADLHLTYVADVERGARNVGILNVIRIARASGISVS